MVLFKASIHASAKKDSLESISQNAACGAAQKKRGFRATVATSSDLGAYNFAD
jgi:hypothetical protein